MLVIKINNGPLCYTTQVFFFSKLKYFFTDRNELKNFDNLILNTNRY